MKSLLEIVCRSVVESTHPEPNVIMDAARGAVEACACEVEAAGCICWCLEDSDEGSQALFTTEYDATGDREVAVHDPRCPHALAAHLREVFR